MNKKTYLEKFTRQSYVHTDINEKLRQYNVDLSELIDCSLGTNPFGCTPKAATVTNCLDGISKYPDPVCSRLNNALVDFWGKSVIPDSESIFVGSGSMSILELINKAYVGSQSKILGYCPQFTEYISEIKVNGGTYDYVPLKLENNFKFSADDIILNIDKLNPDIVYIDNPNNPTGQIIDLKVIEKIVKYANNKNIAVIVDEAYGDYMDKDNSAVNLVKDNGNLIATRSFSKGQGLAGARVGYAVVGDSLKGDLLKVDLPFKVTTLSESLAIIALNDKEYLDECRNKTRVNNEKFIKACSGTFKILETSMDTPILVFGTPNAEVNLYEALLSIGILTESGLDFVNMGKNYVRIRLPIDAEKLIDRIISNKNKLL